MSMLIGARRAGNPADGKKRTQIAWLSLLLLAMGVPMAIAAVMALSGCATVKDYQREYLADPIMAFDRDMREESRELHWREAREGSTGGIGAAGGGCACN